MRVSRIILIVLLVSYAVLWCGGVVSYLFLGGPPAGNNWTAPAFLFVAALLTFYLTSPRWRWQLPVVGIIGMAAEFTGSKWGYPFGAYSYTGVLYPAVLGVPIAIGCAWLILFAYVQQVPGRFRIPACWRAITCAVWMTTLDLLIDPLAAGPLGYWVWSDGGWYYGIPATNFAGWFIVSLLLFLIFPESPNANWGLAYAGLSILLFFTLIAIKQLMIGPMLAAATLLILHVIFLHIHHAPAIENGVVPGVAER